MLRRGWPFVVSVAVLASAWGLCASGCAPSAERVCEHVVDLAGQAADKRHAPLPESGRATVRARCLADLKSQEKTSAKEARCFATCVLEAKLFDDVDTCKGLCAMTDEAPKPAPRPSVSASKKGDDEDAGARAPKKKK